MASVSEILIKMESSPKNIKFLELCKVCDFYFTLRNKSGSHHSYKTPWQGSPRVNIQKDGSKAKIYQVKQVLLAVIQMKEIQTAKEKGMNDEQKRD